MSGKSILFICIMIPLIIYLLSKSDKNAKKSQKYCLKDRKNTLYSFCIQDPNLNNGFIVSASSIDMITEIQTSLNNNDKKYVIYMDNDKYIIKNTYNNNEQILVICDNKKLKRIIDKYKTQSLYSSI